MLTAACLPAGRVEVIKLAVLILAGGQSRRLGRDKAFEKIDSSTSIERVIDSASSVSDTLFIVVNDTEKYRSFSSDSVTVIRDRIPGIGPIGGILTGLEASEDAFDLALSCDSPFLKPRLLRFMLEESEGFDVTLADVEGRLHPMPGVYSKACIEPIADSIRHGQRKIISFFEDVNVNIIDSETIKKYDRDLYSFFNINNEEDLEKARSIAKKIGVDR